MNRLRRWSAYGLAAPLLAVLLGLHALAMAPAASAMAHPGGGQPATVASQARHGQHQPAAVPFSHHAPAQQAPGHQPADPGAHDCHPAGPLAKPIPAPPAAIASVPGASASAGPVWAVTSAIAPPATTLPGPHRALLQVWLF